MISLCEVQTCHSCLLHSIRAQLLLPFVDSLIVGTIFSVLLPPPPDSGSRSLLYGCMCLLLDRVPAVAMYDVVQGWWSGRELRWKRAYVGLTTAVLAYASYVVWVSWYHQIGVWYLLPGEQSAEGELHHPATSPCDRLSRCVVCFACVSRLSLSIGLQLQRSFVYPVGRGVDGRMDSQLIARSLF